MTKNIYTPVFVTSLPRIGKLPSYTINYNTHGGSMMLNYDAYLDGFGVMHF